MGKVLDVDGLEVFNGLATAYAVTNVNDTTPTEAEVVTAFGAIAAKKNAFIGVINDNNGNANIYLVVKAGTKYAFVKLTVCA